jgi:hypothetical protein
VKGREVVFAFLKGVVVFILLRTSKVLPHSPNWWVGGSKLALKNSECAGVFQNVSVSKYFGAICHPCLMLGRLKQQDR